MADSQHKRFFLLLPTLRDTNTHYHCNWTQIWATHCLKAKNSRALWWKESSLHLRSQQPGGGSELALRDHLSELCLWNLIWGGGGLRELGEMMTRTFLWNVRNHRQSVNHCFLHQYFVTFCRCRHPILIRHVSPFLDLLVGKFSFISVEDLVFLKVLLVNNVQT